MIMLLVTFSAAAIAGGCGDSGDLSGASGPDSAAVDKAGGGNGGGRSGEAGADEDGGAGTPDSSSSGEAISKTKFINEANDICAQRVYEILTRTRAYVAQNVADGRSEEELQAESLDTIFVPGIESEIAEIRELGVPAGDEARVEAFLEAMEEGIEVTKKADHRATTIEDFGREYGRAGKLAERYGIEHCALAP